MAIEFKCSSCSKKLKAKDEFAGKKIKCPACGAPVEIPEPEPEIFEMEEPIDGIPEEGRFDPSASFTPAQEEEKKGFKLPPKRLLVTGLVAGALMGTVVVFTSVMMDYLFGAIYARELGVLKLLLFSVIDGVILGGVISVVMIFTDSIGYGIAAGAVLLTVPKTIIMGGFSIIFIPINLMSGAFIGWVIASGVVKIVGTVEQEE